MLLLCAMADKQRQDREAKGRKAERLAAWWLRFKGYRILAMREKTPVGEIDIIARRGDMLVFVEVKARKTLASALEAITPHQRQRIIRAAQYYIAQHPNLANLNLRVDALCLVPRRWPVHMHNICPA
ncbi:MAG: YraN family protein [Pseudomonadota bacterium]